MNKRRKCAVISLTGQGVAWFYPVKVSTSRRERTDGEDGVLTLANARNITGTRCEENITRK